MTEVKRTEDKLKYSDLVEILKDRNSISKHKSNTITKEYSELLKQKILEGYDLDILSIFKIKYVGKDIEIEENKEYGINEQIEDLTIKLNWDKLEVKQLLLDYLRLIKSKLEQGMQVNLKSIGYIVPYEEGSEAGYIVRFSPVLELAETVTVVSLDNSGNFGITKLTKEEVYIKMVCSEKLDRPVFTRNKVELKTIDL